MAQIHEVVRLKDGAEIKVTLNEQEHQYFLEYAINELLARGVLVLGSTSGPEQLIGREEAIEEYNETKRPETLN